jgi:hypothetical protein
MKNTITRAQIKAFYCLIAFIIVFLGNNSLLANETAPAGIGSPTGENGQPRLVMWLDANSLNLEHGQKVLMLEDLSGNNNHASQPVESRRPVFALPADTDPFKAPRILFTASQQHFLPFNGNAIANSNYTFTFVGGRLSNNNFRIFAGGTTPSHNQNLHIYFNNSNNLHHHQYGNDYNSPLVNTGHNGGSGIGSMGIFNLLLDQNAPSHHRKTYQNNDLRGSLNNGNNSKNTLTSWDGAAFARYQNAYHDIALSEVIVYADALNESQIIILNNYLHHKYDIAIKDQKFAPVSALYKRDIVGIGTNDGVSRHTTSNGMGGGIFLAEANNNFALAGERFVFAAHNGQPTGETMLDLPALEDGGLLLARSTRDWYLQRSSANNTEISIGFKLSEINLGQGQNNQIFYLLYRENSGETFTVVPMALSVANQGMVWFSLKDAQVKNGYYTIARSDQVGKTWYSYKNGNWDDFRTWTLEKEGIDYLNPHQLTPTTSPTAHIDKVVINSGHAVTLTANNKKNLALEVENGILDLGNTTGHSFEFIAGTVEGTIRLMGDNFPHGNAEQFGLSNGGNIELYGTGTTLSRSGIYNNLIINLSNKNDVVTLLANYTLNGNLSITRGSMKINNDSFTSIIHLNILGNLEVSSRGRLFVGTGNTASDFSIAGKLPASGLFHAIYHQIKVHGNLINEGSIRLTNQDAPHYKQFTYTGAATFTFAGATHQQAILKGTTDFYSLIIDKGIDQTFELEINPAHENYFRLFGPNNVGRNESAPFNAANPEVRKALWIKNGTLKLTGSAYIPSLTEGDAGPGNGDYPIPANGALWIAGPDVKVFTTAHTSVADYLPGTEGVENGGSNQALTVLGKFKITDGYFSTRNSAGFIFWAASFSTVELHGGTTDVSQFRSANNNLGRSTFIMTGGELIVRGSLNNFDHNGQTIQTAGGEVTNNYPIFGIIDPEGVFNMSGGTISIYKASGNNAYNSNAVLINSAIVNHNATGGTIRFYGYNDNIHYDIVSAGNLFNLEIRQMPATSTRKTFVHMGSDLLLEGSLSVGRNTELIARKQHGSFNGQTFDLSVARGFSVLAGGAYRHFDNTTTLLVTGTQNASIYLPEISFFNLVFAPHDKLVANHRTINHTGYNTNINVHNNLVIREGAIIRHHNQNFVVRGNISNSGEIRKINESSTGRTIITQRGILTGIELNNTGMHTSVPNITVGAPQLPGGIQATAVPVFDGIPAANNALPLAGIALTHSGSGYTSAPVITISSGGATAAANILTNHTIEGNGNGIFSSLEIDEPHPASTAAKTTMLNANITVNDILHLTAGIVDLEGFNLTVEGKLSTYGQANEQDLYSETRMFRMSGKFGDGGLTLKVAENGTYLFPIGTFHSASGTNRYAYAQPTFSEVSTPGRVQINAVPSKLPTLTDESNPNSRRYLQYYWRVRHNFTSGNLPMVHNRFRSYENDFFSGNGDGGFNFNQMVVGKVVNNTRHPLSGQTDSFLGTLDNLGDGFRLLNFNNPTTILEAGEFTSGRRQMFNGTINVFYNRTNLAGISNWNNSSTWSTVGHTSSVNTAGAPGIGDIVNISNSGANNSNHYVRITNNVEAAKVVFNHTGSGWGPRLIIQPGKRADIDIVDGTGGQIGFEFNNNQGMSHLFGDLSGFSADGKGNQVIFLPLSDNNHPILLPDNIREYPSVRIHGPGGNKTHQRIVSFPEDVIIRGNLRIDVSSTLRVHDGAKGNITVLGNLTAGPDSNGGRLEFPSTGPAKKVTVMGNVTVGGVAGHNGTDSEIRVLNSNPSNILHQLEIHGNIELTRNGKINLSAGNLVDGNHVALKLTGNQNAAFTISETTGHPYAKLHTIEIDKGNSANTRFAFNSPFILEGRTDLNEKALTLRNGSLELNNHLINLVLSSGGADFMIPANTGLIINRGTAKITTAGSNGIFLDGLLEVNGPDASQSGRLILDGGEGSDNYIVYSSSGRAQISITGGYMEVGSQIRGSLVNDSGILKYHQLNSSGFATSQVILGKNNAPATNRGILEIHNAGSRFRFFSGSLTLMRGHQNPGTRAALYLNPAVSGLNEWGTINLGDGINTQIITVNSTIELPSVNVKQNTTAQTLINHLAIMGNLSIDSFASFDGNRLNLTVKKHFTNKGIPALNTDTLFLTAISEQWLEGKFTATHLVINPSVRAYLRNNTLLNIEGNLRIAEGLFEDGGNIVTVKGDVVNNATYFSGTNGKLTLNGNQVQYISGLGRFGNIEIDNPAQVRLNNDLNMENHITLTRGVMNIGPHRLSLSASSQIIGDDFSGTKMIATNGSIADKGMRRLINSGSSSQYFPMGIVSGTESKYTPAKIDIAANSGVGHISINPVNQQHMTATNTDVLQYYWIVESHGLSGLTGEMQLHYSADDVRGDESSYYTARLVNDGWQKLPVGINPTDHYAEFYFGSVSSMNGDYTAGVDPHIPAQIPVFLSNGDGNWTDMENWTPIGEGDVPAGGPNGHIVIIREGDEVTLDRFRVLAYRTEIHGKLNAGFESGHNLGRITGEGIINIPDGKLPAGIYTSFMEEGLNSTVEFDGDMDYIIPNLVNYGLSSNTYNNLVIKGEGTKTLPNTDIVVRRNLDIEDNVTIQTRAMQKIYVGGHFTKANTSRLHLDYLGQWIIMNGSDMQIISGQFAGADHTFRNLEVNNAKGVMMMDEASVSESLRLTKGALNTGNRAITVNRAANNAVVAQPGTYVHGILKRNLTNSVTNAFFPVGKSTRKRDLKLHEFTAGIWSAEYFDFDPTNDNMPVTEMDNLAIVDDKEFWRLEGPSGGQAKVELSWGLESSLPEVEPSVLERYIAVTQWENNKWVNKGNSAASANGNGTGNVRASQPSFFLTKSNGAFLTLASTDAELLPLPIELVSFTAKADNDVVLLEWITATEINNDYFTIERSNDGKSFETIAIIASSAENGHSNALLYYATRDNNPLPGLSYYRLKQTDFDGSFAYSDLVSVSYGSSSEMAINVFPNPNSGNSFRIALNGLTPYESLNMNIIDSFGKTLYKSQISTDANGNLMAFIIPNGRLKAGVYMVSVSNGTTMQNTRLVVNN